jgi:hypothetical protein
MASHTADVAGRRIDEHLARPELEAAKVHFGRRAVAELEVERRLRNIDRGAAPGARSRVPIAASTPLSARFISVGGHRRSSRSI